MVRSFDIGSYWISTYCDIDWEIGDRTGARLGDLGGDLLGIVFLILWDFHLFCRSES